MSDQPFSITDNSGKTGWLYGVYLQDEWKILPEVTVNFGARFDLIDEFTHENQLSPRVNVVWEPTDSTTFTAGYARYFTPPPFELIGATDIALFANTSAAPAVTTDDGRPRPSATIISTSARPRSFCRGSRSASTPTTRSPQNLIDEGQFGAPILLDPVQLCVKAASRGAELSAELRQGQLVALRQLRGVEGGGRRHPFRPSSTSPPTTSPSSPTTSSISTTIRRTRPRPGSRIPFR